MILCILLYLVDLLNLDFFLQFGAFFFNVTNVLKFKREIIHAQNTLNKSDT